MGRPAKSAACFRPDRRPRLTSSQLGEVDNYKPPLLTAQDAAFFEIAQESAHMLRGAPDRLRQIPPPEWNPETDRLAVIEVPGTQLGVCQSH